MKIKIFELPPPRFFCCFKIGILLFLRGLYHVFVVVLSVLKGLMIFLQVPLMFPSLSFSRCLFSGVNFSGVGEVV